MKTIYELSGDDRVEYDHFAGQYSLVAEGEPISLGNYEQAMCYLADVGEALTKIDAFLGEGKVA